MALPRTDYQGTAKAVIPQNEYFWLGPLPKVFLCDHGKVLLSNARLGRVSANSVIAIAGLIEQQMIGVYGNADGTVTETLNRVKDAVIAAQAWAAANQGLVPRNYPDLGTFTKESTIFEALTTGRLRNFEKKFKTWNDLAKENGLSVGWREYFRQWDYKSVVTDQTAIFTAANVRLVNAQRLADIAGNGAENAGGANEHKFAFEDIPEDAFGRSVNRKRVRGSLYKDDDTMSDDQVKAYLIKMAVFVGNDIAKNPNLPVRHPNHTESEQLRQRLESDFYQYFQEFMGMRAQLVQNICDAEGLVSMSYEDCPQKFNVLNNYSAAKLVELRVWAGLEMAPEKFKAFFDLSDAALAKVITSLSIESHKAQTKKHYILDGARLKAYASLRGNVLKSFKLIGGSVRRVNVASGTELAQGRFEDFDECMPRDKPNPKKKRRKDKEKDKKTDTIPDDTHDPTTGASADVQALTATVNLLLEQLQARLQQDAPAKNVYNSQSDKAVQEMRDSATRGAIHFSKEFVVNKTLKGFRAIRAGIAEVKRNSPQELLYSNIMSNDLKNKDKVGSLQGM